MKILLTGANGYFGTHLNKELTNNTIKTLGRKNCHYVFDLRSNSPKFDEEFETVIHAAGKAHLVPKHEKEARDFFDVNVTGTINLLKGLENALLPRKFVFISSVAVYGLESGLLIPESSDLKAKDPYGKSKVQAEEIINNWCSKNNIKCTILRLPLIAGINPPGNLRAMIKGIQKGYYFNIAGGTARKSMVMAEDVAKYILPASEIGGIYNLTDGHHPSFYELSAVIARKLNKPKPVNIPSVLAHGLAKIGDIVGRKSLINSYKLNKILSDLTFDDTKARKEFGWSPRPVLEIIET
ncbi:NAD-dependent epimerase/dehydratase family protein [Desertivirga brevis]|uniref:NAD-dependent epimerase/dehydratase family protein n=1 Tax=Desertivirga brevis TaxID=2810310 RepID=UPI001A95A699|nr:NAD-dependent epimerase/dehydratase family protein [Pedobacter sp. SYSU D00873]